MGGACSRYGERRSFSRLLVVNPEGNRSHHTGLGGKIILKMDRQEVRCGGKEFVGLSQDWDIWRALVSVLMNFRVLLKAWNFLAS